MFETNQEFFDSRDLIERIEELEALEEAFLSEDASQEDVNAFGREEDDELATLRNFASEASDYCVDWEYGETFIRDDYFTEYTKEMLVDCGYIPSNLPEWILIDWEGTAEKVKDDYTEYTLDGVTYWAR